MQFTPLLCSKRIQETADAATFEFKHLDNKPFDYQAGQFLTFEVDVAGELEYRSYSLSSCPSSPQTAAVTIKRVENGKVSNYLLDHLNEGIALPAMPPAGEFTLQQCQTTQSIIFMCAGSGITPCISMARWLLTTEQQVEIQFIYSARSEADVIMAKDLAKLDKLHSNFRLDRIIENSNNNSDHVGRLNAQLFASLVENLAGKTIFTCGPAPYMAVVEDLAIQRNFDMSLFHKESFVPSQNEAMDNKEPDVSHQVVLPQFGKITNVKASENLLSAIEAENIPIVAACRSGICGSCKCKVTGEVESSSHASLSEEQIKQGYVLACSTKALSDLVVEI